MNPEYIIKMYSTKMKQMKQQKHLSMPLFGDNEDFTLFELQKEINRVLNLAKQYVITDSAGNLIDRELTYHNITKNIDTYLSTDDIIGSLCKETQKTNGAFYTNDAEKHLKITTEAETKLPLFDFCAGNGNLFLPNHDYKNNLFLFDINKSSLDECLRNITGAKVFLNDILLDGIPDWCYQYKSKCEIRMNPPYIQIRSIRRDSPLYKSRMAVHRYMNGKIYYTGHLNFCHGICYKALTELRPIKATFILPHYAVRDLIRNYYNEYETKIISQCPQKDFDNTTLEREIYFIEMRKLEPNEKPNMNSQQSIIDELHYQNPINTHGVPNPRFSLF